RRQRRGGDAVGHEEAEYGHEAELQRDREHADDGQEDPVPERELHPCERIGGERRDRDRDDGGRDRDHEAVEEAVAQVAGGQHLRVVVERELEGRREGQPPAAAVDRRERPEGREQDADGGNHPGHGQADHGQVQHHPAQAAGDPLWRKASGGSRGTGSVCCRRNAHRRASTARNWRRLKISTGTTAASRIMATAAAPPWLPEKKSSLYMRLASTSVSKLPPVIT